ncbi:PTS sugar transporter subunit IIC [Fictibacillus phosphorivorans]|uniref:PTS sugar transporter subunit IIC n=1 Tax=Fictibacillus phosphorivorans TaxID=1221500 RepID=A0A163Q657_9BACL|nr:PTS sugar transporter subunit IIC [Fictibacillus phosphorivorans]KZE64612.1 PTS sugar transporter subunit IIC [Fictibacillus phosphorivorans]
MRDFLQKKGVSLSPKIYFITGFQYFALGLMSSLIVGLILKTIGEELSIPYFTEMGQLAMTLMGPVIGTAVAFGLKAPPLVMFSSGIAGAAGAELGSVAGCYVAAVIAVEVGKLVSGETKFDILVTPAVTILTGYTVATFIGPGIDQFMKGFGQLVMWSTDQRPFVMGILVAVLLGFALTGPISSAAIAMMLGLEGLAAGAATIGCAAQMIGFATSSFRENGFGGWFTQGIGTSKLQFPNVVKNPYILIPPTIAGIVLAPIGTLYFKMENIPAGAGMGTSGLVGQIMTLRTMGFTFETFLAIFILHFAGPIIISLVISEWLRKKGYIKFGDMKLNQ